MSWAVRDKINVFLCFIRDHTTNVFGYYKPAKQVSWAIREKKSKCPSHGFILVHFTNLNQFAENKYFERKVELFFEYISLHQNIKLFQKNKLLQPLK